MAEALARHYFGKSIYCQSAGVRPGERDPVMGAAVDEIGIDATKHKPRALIDPEEWEGLTSAHIVSMAREPNHEPQELARAQGSEVKYWPAADPTIVQGSRE